MGGKKGSYRLFTPPLGRTRSAGFYWDARIARMSSAAAADRTPDGYPRAGVSPRLRPAPGGRVALSHGSWFGHRLGAARDCRGGAEGSRLRPLNYWDAEKAPRCLRATGPARETGPCGKPCIAALRLVWAKTKPSGRSLTAYAALVWIILHRSVDYIEHGGRATNSLRLISKDIGADKGFTNWF
jgi:hypothetical protein